MRREKYENRYTCCCRCHQTTTGRRTGQNSAAINSFTQVCSPKTSLRFSSNMQNMCTHFSLHSDFKKFKILKTTFFHYCQLYCLSPSIEMFCMGVCCNTQQNHIISLWWSGRAPVLFHGLHSSHVQKHKITNHPFTGNKLALRKGI